MRKTFNVIVDVAGVPSHAVQSFMDSIELRGWGIPGHTEDGKWNYEVEADQEETARDLIKEVKESAVEADVDRGWYTVHVQLIEGA